MNTSFRRKIYAKLLAWKAQNGRTALLLEGARRIGKSTIASTFGQKEYKSCVIIDFNNISETVRLAFRNYLNDLNTFFMLLSTEYKTTLYERETLFVFDEVQQFPIARQAIKYLVADGRYDFLETGSLISIKNNVKDITIPSEEEKLNMYPMDFEEFCWAVEDSESLTKYIRHCYENHEPLEQGLHHKTMLLFRQYILVGGMPKPVDVFIQSKKDFKKVDKEKRMILDLYRADIAKIDSSYKSRVLSIFDFIPSALARQDKRVILRNLEPGSSFPVYEETFFWLSDSMICNECFNCQDPNVALSLNAERTFIKCYMGDTGLLISHTFEAEVLDKGDLYKEILTQKLSLNEGMFFENVVMQMLVAAGHKPFFYVHYNNEKHRNDIEIDFLVANKSKLHHQVSPIEVKSNDRYSITSLTKFKEHFSDKIGQCYVIHPKNFKEENGITYLPVYMTFCLE